MYKLHNIYLKETTSTITKIQTDGKQKFLKV